MADVQTFKNLQDKVLAWLDEAGDTSTTLTLVKYALIEAHKHRVGQERWDFMLYPPQTINVVANQQSYALHSEYFRPHYFFNTSLHDYVTVYKATSLPSAGQDWTTDTGDALKAVLRANMPVAMQPPTPATIHATSTQGGDNNKATVQIIGDTTAGIVTEVLTAGGAASTNTYTNILKVTKLTPWAGTLALVDANNNTLLNLFTNEPGRNYRELFLLQIPDAAQTIQYQFYRQPSPLVNDNDLTDIPTPFEEVLVWDTLLSFAAYNEYAPVVVKLWTEKREKTALAMKQALQDDRALEEEASYTDFIPRG